MEQRRIYWWSPMSCDLFCSVRCETRAHASEPSARLMMLSSTTNSLSEIKGLLLENILFHTHDWLQYTNGRKENTCMLSILVFWNRAGSAFQIDKTKSFLRSATRRTALLLPFTLFIPLPLSRFSLPWVGTEARALILSAVALTPWMIN